MRIRAWIVLALLFSACGLFRRDDRDGEEAPPDPALPPASDPFPELALPAPRTRTLANGLTLSHLPAWDPAVIHLRAVVRAGYAAEATAGVARASAALALHEAGGFTADELATALERLGGDASFAVTPDTTTLALNAPAERFDEAAQLFATMVLSPAAHDDALNGVRARLMPRDDGSDAALWLRGWGRMARVLFIDQPLAAAVPSRQELEAVTVDDVLRFRQGRWTPSRAAVVVVGAPSDEAVAALAGALGAWTGRDGPGDPPVRPRRPVAGLHVEDRPGGAWARISIGVLAYPGGSLNAFAADLLAEAIAGGDQSPLAQAVIAAGVADTQVSWESHLSDEAGVVELRLRVPAAQARVAVDAAFGALDRVRQVGPTPERLAAARGALAARFLGGLSSIDAVGELATSAWRMSVDLDWWTQYPQTLLAVPPEDVVKVAGALLRSERLVVVVTGERAALGDLAGWQPPPAQVVAGP